MSLLLLVRTSVDGDGDEDDDDGDADDEDEDGFVDFGANCCDPDCVVVVVFVGALAEVVSFSSFFRKTKIATIMPAVTSKKTMIAARTIIENSFSLGVIVCFCFCSSSSKFVVENVDDCL